MKKVKNRALCALLIVALTIIGIGFYIAMFAINGRDWAGASFNSAAYSGGALVVGSLTDRNGVTLSTVADGKRVFADSIDTRKATLHAVGDAYGNIGTGALSVYAPNLIGYNIVNGAYSRAGAGKTVALTLDSRLNVEAYKALNGKRGTVLVMNYETGEILCMVSNPTFDPANPPKDIENNPSYEGVYLNRAISAAYTPGSTFKLLTAAAAIENIDGIFEREFECKGKLETGHGTVTCSGTHGKLGFQRALTVSCNSVFGELALELGAEKLASYAEKYGLSERATIGGIETAKGNFDKAQPDTADLAWSGVGQYNDTVCPVAMLRYVGAIANGGTAVDMCLIKKSGLELIFPGGAKTIMKSETAAVLGGMMDYGVHQQNVAGNFKGLELHAKTGTAEVGSGKNPHAWFAGYITNEGYPLAFVVVVENGGGGFAVASPIANKVLQAAIKG
ncbi:MAG: penicillin-binding transpeptidase domain-containing protein [Oscillospiraceae bacterium]|nr:penicillin-binding transpeptidase domain-containing protein [Oscillospiraceae bacterium]